MSAITIGLIIVAALALGAIVLLFDQVSRKTRKGIMWSAQALNDVLGAWAKTDNELREYSREALLELKAEAESLLDKSEELFQRNRHKAGRLLKRTGYILEEKD